MKASNSRTRHLLASLFVGVVVASGLTIGEFHASDSSHSGVPLATQVAHADNDVLDRVADNIERAYKRDSVLRRYNLDADEDDNHIEIEGRVSRQAERDRAYRIARQHTPRRYRVVNKIRVGGRR